MDQRILIIHVTLAAAVEVKPAGTPADKPLPVYQGDEFRGFARFKPTHQNTGQRGRNTPMVRNSGRGPSNPVSHPPPNSPTGTATLKNRPNPVMTQPRISSRANNRRVAENGTLNRGGATHGNTEEPRATQNTGISPTSTSGFPPSGKTRPPARRTAAGIWHRPSHQGSHAL